MPVQAATGLQSIRLLSHWTQSGPTVQVLVPEQETPNGGAWQLWLALQVAESEVVPKTTKSSEKIRIPYVLRMSHLPWGARRDVRQARGIGDRAPRESGRSESREIAISINSGARRPSGETADSPGSVSSFLGAIRSLLGEARRRSLADLPGRRFPLTNEQKE